LARIGDVSAFLLLSLPEVALEKEFVMLREQRPGIEGLSRASGGVP
jgi:hypothetical protein